MAAHRGRRACARKRADRLRQDTDGLPRCSVAVRVGRLSGKRTLGTVHISTQSAQRGRQAQPGDPIAGTGRLVRRAQDPTSARRTNPQAATTRQSAIWPDSWLASFRRESRDLHDPLLNLDDDSILPANSHGSTERHRLRKLTTGSLPAFILPAERRPSGSSLSTGGAPSRRCQPQAGSTVPTTAAGVSRTRPTSRATARASSGYSP